jgi:hypothetical protein
LLLGFVVGITVIAGDELFYCYCHCLLALQPAKIEIKKVT